MSNVVLYWFIITCLDSSCSFGSGRNETGTNNKNLSNNPFDWSILFRMCTMDFICVAPVNNDYKIKVSDVKLAAEKVLGIEVITENIKF